jgi:hypothetical protein
LVHVNLRKIGELSPRSKGLVLLSLILVPTSIAIAWYWGINWGQLNPPVKMLFIGNSLTYYYGGVDYHVEQLGLSASPPRTIEADESTASMAHLAQLYSTALTRIATGSYDFVIVQGTPYLAGIESFKTYARLLIEAIRDVGAEPVLFMAWEALGAPYWEPDLQLLPLSIIAQAHYELAEELDVLVAPVGLAFRKVNETRPGYQIYSDVMHSSMNGTYLAALVIYATIFKENPVGLAYRPTSPPLPSHYLNVSAEDATFLQEIAWETIQENPPLNHKNMFIYSTVQYRLMVYGEPFILLITKLPLKITSHQIRTN